MAWYRELPFNLASLQVVWIFHYPVHKISAQIYAEMRPLRYGLTKLYIDCHQILVHHGMKIFTIGTLIT